MKVLRFILALFLAGPLCALLSPVRASVVSSTARISYTIGALPATLPVTFPYNISAGSYDLVVWDGGATNSGHSPPIQLTYASDYTVTGGGYNSQNQLQTGNVVVVAGGSNNVQVGDVITILRNTPFTQTTTFASTGFMTPLMIESGFDKLTTETQQLKDLVNLSLSFQPNETLSNQLVLTSRIGNLLGFGSTGAIQYYAQGGGGGGGTTYSAGYGLSLSVANVFSLDTSITQGFTLTIATLKAISTTLLPNGYQVNVGGYFGSSDGGGGIFRWVPAGVQPDNGGTVIHPNVGSGTWNRILAPDSVYYAKWFGVKADGSTNDSAALQACITASIALPNNARCPVVVLPSGEIVLGTTITINCPSFVFSMRGQGPRSTTFQINSSIGDVFDITGCPGGRFSGFGIEASIELTTGIFLNCNTCTWLTLEDLYIRDSFQGIKITNSAGVFLEHISAASGQYYTDVTYKANTWLLYLAPGTNNGIYVTDCGFDVNSLTPSTGSKMQYSVWIEGVDGAWFENVHMSGGHFAHFQIDGNNVGGVKCTNVWCDFYALNCLNIGTNSAVDASALADFSFTNCTFQGSTNDAVVVWAPGLHGAMFNNCTFELAGGSGLDVYGGHAVSITGGRFYGNGGTTAHTANIIVTNAPWVEDFNITGVAFEAGSANIDYHLNVSAAAPVGGASVINMNPGSFAAATLGNIFYGGGSVVHLQPYGGYTTLTYASPTVVTTKTGDVFKTTTVNATGSVTFNADAIGERGQHMEIIILNDATSGKTITFGTNFKPSATIVGTTSKVATIRFTSDGTNGWYEVSRTLLLPP